MSKPDASAGAAGNRAQADGWDVSPGNAQGCARNSPEQPPEAATPLRLADLRHKSPARFSLIHVVIKYLPGIVVT